MQPILGPRRYRAHRPLNLRRSEAPFNMSVGILNDSIRTERCIAIGQELGRLDDTTVSKGCTSSYAPEWIAAVLKRGK